MKIGQITLLVHEYEEAIAFYCDYLGFELVEDTPLSAEKRWVRVAPPGNGVELLLARAVGNEQISMVGKQGGGRVFLFLHTDDFDRDYDAMRSKGVEFSEQPRHEAYGTVAVFADLYGNKWDLLQLK